jgi:tRNA nucleotidyltransferase/poly(A) polymerase/2'-5' RNA ligase
MGKLNDFINVLKEKPFIKSLINDLKSDVYVIGGAVRDLILNKQNKDIDLIVTKIPIDTLISHLQKFGKVDVVGKSFGVIKFIDADGINYDIALPRTDKKNNMGGYRGFDVQSDENLPIEDDLSRRDAKMNAMAINVNTGKFIDPLGGLKDIENKQISAANTEAFSDDPLRMLRIVGFASRFGFTIEPQTMKMIQNNAAKVREIAPERILIELDKIVRKGDKFTGAYLLKSTGLLKNIFGTDTGLLVGNDIWNKVKTMGEFIWLLSHNLVANPAEFFKTRLKGDDNIYKEIKALMAAFGADVSNPVAARSVAHNMYIIYPLSLKSQIIPEQLQIAVQELLSGKYPKTVGELAVNGNDLMQLGLKNKEIGDAQKMLLLKIYSDSIKNNKEELLSLLNQKSNLQESVSKKKDSTDKIEHGCLMLFLDVPIWEKITSVIKTEDVYNKPGYGIEKEPHITILYGFKNEVNSQEVFSLYKENIELKPIEVRISGISIFENPEFDVVKYDVNSKLLTKLNKLMKGLPNISTFPDYHPHITLAYVKKGEGKKYVKHFKKDRILKGSELVFTWKGHKGKDGDTLMLDEKGLLKEEYNEVGDGKYLVNDVVVNINFFVNEYDKWNNQSEVPAYKDPSEASVLEFFQNNYEDYCHNEKLKHQLLWALTDREILNESKSDYSDTKESLMKSKSISAEMKKEILKYLTGGSTYKEGGHVHGLLKPKELINKTPKADGVSMGADKNGFFVYTHRARSDSHATPEKIPVKEINFIESTG